MHPSRLSSFKRNIGGRECALRATRRARTTLVLPEGDESGDDFFWNYRRHGHRFAKKKGKKREERGIISKIVGTTIVSRSGIFFIVFRSNFENGDDEAEEKWRKMEDENFVHLFFFFGLISKFRSSICDENRENWGWNYGRIFECFCRFMKF